MKGQQCKYCRMVKPLFFAINNIAVNVGQAAIA